MKNSFLPSFMVISVIFTTLVLVAGCAQTETEEMSEAEIVELLSQVVAGEEAIEEAGQRYFLGLSNENNNIIAPAALHERLTNGEPITVVDIRRAQDYAQGHIQGARNIWWFDVGHHLAELPLDQRILVTCYSGQAAGQVVGVLRTMGYEAVSLAGGMNNGWYASELPVVTD